MMINISLMMVTMNTTGAGRGGRTLPMWGTIYLGGYQYGTSNPVDHAL